MIYKTVNMQDTKIKSNQHISKTDDDFLYHIQMVKTDIARLYLDHNSDKSIQYFAESTTRELDIAIACYLDQDKSIFRKLKNDVNGLIKKNPNQKGIMIKLENSRSRSDSMEINYLKYQI